MIRVLIADDHPMVRKGLAQMVSESGDLECAGEAENALAVSRVLRKDRVDVLLLDVDIPGKNGLDILKAVRRSHPGVQVLMFSMYPEEQYAVRALQAGAAGYLCKNTPPHRIIEALRCAARGRKYVSPELAQTLASRISEDVADGRPPHELLSDREFQTMRCIAGGRKLAEIAAEMSLSPKTVSVYRARLLEKMKLRNNADLTRYAIRNRLVD
ncbi:MAG: response regulator [Betaproteobacteria bacterium]